MNIGGNRFGTGQIETAVVAALKNTEVGLSESKANRQDIRQIAVARVEDRVYGSLVVLFVATGSETCDTLPTEVVS